MKAFLSFDMEGVAGIVDWDQCQPGSDGYATGCRLLLGEVNAVIDGALAGGATEVLCCDAHGAMHNLDPEALHGGAALVAGRHKPLYMMQGLDQSFGAALFVGYHGSISGESAILSHTYNPSVISLVELNGQAVGESGVNALVALALGVPVALVSGDHQTAKEAAPLFPDAELVVVKESVTRFAATAVHPEEARAQLRRAAQRAVERAASLRLPAIDLPARLDVHVQTADMAEVASWAKGVERSGVRQLTLEGEDPLAIYRSFVALTYLTRVAEGR